MKTMQSYQSRCNPNCLMRMARGVKKIRRLLVNYFFYRSLPNPRKVAWDKARNTL